MAWKQPLGRGNFEKRPKPKPRTLAGLMVNTMLSAHRNIVRSIHVATWHEDGCRHLWPTRNRSDARGTSWAPHLRVRGHSRGAGGSTRFQEEATRWQVHTAQPRGLLRV